MKSPMTGMIWPSPRFASAHHLVSWSAATTTIAIAAMTQNLREPVGASTSTAGSTAPSAGSEVDGTRQLCGVKFGRPLPAAEPRLEVAARVIQHRFDDADEVGRLAGPL